MNYVIAAILLLQAHPGHGAEDLPAQRPTTILRALPETADFYREPAAALVREGVPDRFGREEWAAIVLTHEIHQHVGIYTLLGAKMAVRAREILNAPMRAVKVRALTGTKQPLACMVDGLQVGLGSTFGQNLIEAPEVERPGVAAEFSFKEKAVTLTLKPEYQERIAGYIQEAIEEHGNLTPAYFKEVETISYTIWAEFDRKAIFEETGAAE